MVTRLMDDCLLIIEICTLLPGIDIFIENEHLVPHILKLTRRLRRAYVISERRLPTRYAVEKKVSGHLLAMHVIRETRVSGGGKLEKTGEIPVFKGNRFEIRHPFKN